MSASTVKKQGGLWLITLADLVTLMLAMFVLIFSMSSLDSGMLERISSGIHGNIGTEGRLDGRIRLVRDMLLDSDAVRQKEERIKDLLFPDDMLPPEVDKGVLKDNVRILGQDGGVAIVLSDKLLFPENSSRLPEPARVILSAVTPLLYALEADIVISGHSDIPTGRSEAKQDAYILSGKRALAVLDFYLTQGVKNYRFSVSGYGPDRPVDSNDTAESRAKNRRVEILLKIFR